MQNLWGWLMKYIPGCWKKKKEKKRKEKERKEKSKKKKKHKEGSIKICCS